MGLVFIGLIHGPTCLKGLIYGSSLNKTIFTCLYFPFLLPVIKLASFYCIFSPLAVLVIYYSRLSQYLKLLEAARAILLRLPLKKESTASAQIPEDGEMRSEEEVSEEEEEFDPPNATLRKAEGEVPVLRITGKKFRANPWPRILESDLGEDERTLCALLSQMRIEEKGKRMELIPQKKTVCCSIEVQCNLGGASLLHLPHFDASLPAAKAPKTPGAFNSITFVNDVEQVEQPSVDQQERTGAADVGKKDHAAGAIAKAQQEKRHTVATRDNLQITISCNKRKDPQQQQQQQQQQEQPSTSQPAAPARKARKAAPEQQQQRQQQQQHQGQRRRGQKLPPRTNQALVTVRAQKRFSDKKVVTLGQQRQFQRQNQGQQHPQRNALPQQRPTQGRE